MFDVSDTGMLTPCEYVPSENHNDRLVNGVIDLLVIHGISLPPGKYGGAAIKDFFCNQLDVGRHEYFQQIKDLKVSSHLLIERDGNVVQFVPFIKRAWHAGVSSFDNRDNCNDYSIGIELEGTDTEAYSDEQYSQLVLVTKAIQQSYSLITKNRIVGHSTIAPGRKTDPGSSFDWERYYDGLL